MFALNLDNENRIVSACVVLENGNYDKMIIVDNLPDGNIVDYLYDNGKYLYSSYEEIYKKTDEYKQMQINQLKAQLAETDYKAIKFAEGWITAEEYEPVKAERQAIRDKINELEIDIFA